MAISNDSEIHSHGMIDVEIPQLPTDVIIHIMSFLTVSDRMAAGLVNRAWREASLTMKFLDKQVVCVGQPRSYNLNQISKVLRYSARPFYHFIFKKIELQRDSIIWDLYGPYIRSLMLLFCDLGEKTIIDILKCCNDLRVLHIDGCQEYLMSGRLLENNNDIKEISEKFQSLEELSLGYNRFLSDALFNRLIAICPNIKSLSLMGCHITFHSGLYKKFYPHSTATLPEASNSVLTFLNTLHSLKQHARKLKHLNFGYTLIDGAALSTLSTLEGLKLESLLLQGCYQLTVGGIKGLTQYQTCLKVLDVSYCVRITDVSLVCICKNLKYLEVLRVRKCRALTDCGVEYVRLLQNLKELDISEDELLTGNCITQGLCNNTPNVTDNSNNVQDIDSAIMKAVITENNRNAERNARYKRLEVLSANTLNLHEESIICLAVHFPNLRILEISYCFNAVTDKTIQIIFKELVHLQVLKISYCNKISDGGLIGMDPDKDTSLEKAPVECAREHAEPMLRISLRSRAEEEIVRDADRKREVIKFCEEESTPLDPNSYTGFSLIRLKSLRELNLSGCNRITDVSLKYAFAFLELRILNLSCCQRITCVGLGYLSENNPAIEDLNLSQCPGIGDTGIKHLARKLYRLKRLVLKGCSGISDNGLEYLQFFCKGIQHLNISCCRNITMKGINQLVQTYGDCIEHTACMLAESEITAVSPPPVPPPMPLLVNQRFNGQL